MMLQPSSRFFYLGTLFPSRWFGLGLRKARVASVFNVSVAGLIISLDGLPARGRGCNHVRIKTRVIITIVIYRYPFIGCQ